MFKRFSVHKVIPFSFLLLVVFAAQMSSASAALLPTTSTVSDRPVVECFLRRASGNQAPAGASPVQLAADSVRCATENYNHRAANCPTGTDSLGAAIASTVTFRGPSVDIVYQGTIYRARAYHCDFSTPVGTMHCFLERPSPSDIPDSDDVQDCQAPNIPVAYAKCDASQGEQPVILNLVPTRFTRFRQGGERDNFFITTYYCTEIEVCFARRYGSDRSASNHRDLVECVANPQPVPICSVAPFVHVEYLGPESNSSTQLELRISTYRCIEPPTTLVPTACFVMRTATNIQGAGIGDVANCVPSTRATSAACTSGTNVVLIDENPAYIRQNGISYYITAFRCLSGIKCYVKRAEGPFSGTPAENSDVRACANYRILTPVCSATPNVRVEYNNNTPHVVTSGTSTYLITAYRCRADRASQLDCFVMRTGSNAQGASGADLTTCESTLVTSPVCSTLTNLVPALIDSTPVTISTAGATYSITAYQCIARTSTEQNCYIRRGIDDDRSAQASEASLCAVSAARQPICNTTPFNILAFNNLSPVRVAFGATTSLMFAYRCTERLSSLLTCFVQRTAPNLGNANDADVATCASNSRTSPTCGVDTNLIGVPIGTSPHPATIPANPPSSNARSILIVAYQCIQRSSFLQSACFVLRTPGDARIAQASDASTCANVPAPVAVCNTAPNVNVFPNNARPLPFQYQSQRFLITAYQCQPEAFCYALREDDNESPALQSDVTQCINTPAPDPSCAATPNTVPLPNQATPTLFTSTSGTRVNIIAYQCVPQVATEPITCFVLLGDNDNFRGPLQSDAASCDSTPSPSPSCLSLRLTRYVPNNLVPIPFQEGSQIYLVTVFRCVSDADSICYLRREGTNTTPSMQNDVNACLVSTNTTAPICDQEPNLTVVHLQERALGFRVGNNNGFVYISTYQCASGGEPDVVVPCFLHRDIADNEPANSGDGNNCESSRRATADCSFMPFTAVLKNNPVPVRVLFGSVTYAITAFRCVRELVCFVHRAGPAFPGATENDLSGCISASTALVSSTTYFINSPSCNIYPDTIPLPIDTVSNRFTNNGDAAYIVAFRCTSDGPIVTPSALNCYLLRAPTNSDGATPAEVGLCSASTTTPPVCSNGTFLEFNNTTPVFGLTSAVVYSIYAVRCSTVRPISGGACFILRTNPADSSAPRDTDIAACIASLGTRANCDAITGSSVTYNHGAPVPLTDTSSSVVYQAFTYRCLGGTGTPTVNCFLMRAANVSTVATAAEANQCSAQTSTPPFCGTNLYLEFLNSTGVIGTANSVTYSIYAYRCVATPPTSGGTCHFMRTDPADMRVPTSADIQTCIDNLRTQPSCISVPGSTLTYNNQMPVAIVNASGGATYQAFAYRCVGGTGPSTANCFLMRAANVSTVATPGEANQCSAQTSTPPFCGTNLYLEFLNSTGVIGTANNVTYTIYAYRCVTTPPTSGGACHFMRTDPADMRVPTSADIQTCIDNLRTQPSCTSVPGSTLTYNNQMPVTIVNASGGVTYQAFAYRCVGGTVGGNRVACFIQRTSTTDSSSAQPSEAATCAANPMGAPMCNVAPNLNVRINNENAVAGSFGSVNYNIFAYRCLSTLGTRVACFILRTATNTQGATPDDIGACLNAPETSPMCTAFVGSLAVLNNIVPVVRSSAGITYLMFAYRCVGGSTPRSQVLCFVERPFGNNTVAEPGDLPGCIINPRPIPLCTNTAFPHVTFNQISPRPLVVTTTIHFLYAYQCTPTPSSSNLCFVMRPVGSTQGAGIGDVNLCVAGSNTRTDCTSVPNSGPVIINGLPYITFVSSRAYLIFAYTCVAGAVNPGENLETISVGLGVIGEQINLHKILLEATDFDSVTRPSVPSIANRAVTIVRTGPTDCSVIGNENLPECSAVVNRRAQGFPGVPRRRVVNQGVVNPGNRPSSTRRIIQRRTIQGGQRTFSNTISLFSEQRDSQSKLSALGLGSFEGPEEAENDYVVCFGKGVSGSAERQVVLGECPDNTSSAILDNDFSDDRELFKKVKEKRSGITLNSISQATNQGLESSNTRGFQTFVSADPTSETKTGIYALGFGTTSTTRAQSDGAFSLVRTTSDAYGGSAGFVVQLSPAVRVNVGGLILAGEVETEIPNSSDTLTTEQLGYGGVASLGYTSGPFDVKGKVSVLFVNNTTKRSNLPGETESSDLTAIGQLRAGYNLASSSLPAQAQIKPFIGVSFIYAQAGENTISTSSGIYNVEEASGFGVDLDAGLTAQFTFNVTEDVVIRPEFTGSISAPLVDLELESIGTNQLSNVRANLVRSKNGELNFTAAPKIGVVVDNTISLGIGYTGRFSKYTTSHTGSGQVGFTF